MDLLKLRYLHSHIGNTIRNEGPMGFTPYNSKGDADWDSFITFVINEGTNMIDYYTMYNIVADLAPEVKSKYAIWVKQVEKTVSIKPIHQLPFDFDEGGQGYEARLNAALQYYSKCLKAVIICDELVFEAVGKII